MNHAIVTSIRTLTIYIYSVFSRARVQVDVPTVDGDVQLRIPAGTQSGDRLLLRGRGIVGAFGRGNQIVVVQVEVPKTLTQRQRELLEEFAREEEAKGQRRKRWGG